MNYSENQWTPAELEFLQAHYGTMPVREISAWLSKHTLQGIYQKASSIGLKRRTPRQRKGIQPTGNRRRPSSGMKRCTNHGRKKSPVTMAPMTPLAIATNACIIPQGSTNAAVGT